MYSPAPEDFVPDNRADLEFSAFQQVVRDIATMNLTYLAEWLQTLPDDVLLNILPPDHFMFEGSGRVREEAEDNLDVLLEEFRSKEHWWDYDSHIIDDDYRIEIVGVN